MSANDLPPQNLNQSKRSDDKTAGSYHNHHYSNQIFVDQSLMDSAR
jgi:hypothetical protein